MTRFIIGFSVLLGLSQVATAEERFGTIQKVQGQSITFVESTSRGRGAMQRGEGDGAPKKGRGRPSSETKAITLQIPAGAKITTAQRERRTAEFRVGAELSGGLRHQVFKNIDGGLEVRIVSDGKQITEINVITNETDINQSNASSDGETVIAVRPKRPPSKRK